MKIEHEVATSMDFLADYSKVNRASWLTKLAHAVRPSGTVTRRLLQTVRSKIPSADVGRSIDLSMNYVKLSSRCNSLLTQRRCLTLKTLMQPTRSQPKLFPSSNHPTILNVWCSMIISRPRSVVTIHLFIYLSIDWFYHSLVVTFFIFAI